MPEFILNAPPPPSWFSSLDAFTQGYIEAAFFTNLDTGDDDEWSSNNLGVERLTKKARAAIEKDCAKFLADNARLLAIAERLGRDLEECGRDFWFTRQGHGVGFWSRSELGRFGIGEALSEKARRFGEVYFEIANGWIYGG